MNNSQKELRHFINSKHRKRKILCLLVVIFITSITLAVETYAWFVGIAVAAVSPFNISVSTGEGLELSLDGNTWNNSLTISQSSIENAYTGNTNKWPTNGLSPVSSAGQIDDTVSRLILYEKYSITSTPGGYRLMTSRINNYTSKESSTELITEQDGYLVFDLFIRNGTASYYKTEYNNLDNEEVYLTNNSQVVSTSSGAVDYGIANSLRIGFFEIGRVASSSSADVIRSIQCTNNSANVTGLCNIDTNGETWNIWEPNDDKHDSALVTQFNRVCKKRTSATEYSTTSCTALTTTSKVNTYVVNDMITSLDSVDIYDGLNNYNTSITNEKLKNIEVFSDSEDKSVTGVNRKSIFKLASNSVTKVRVYIYLEGQDVDNYDLIANTYQIRVNFGFTKDINNEVS
jgi:hypothetical protein